jgi:hypothetical protein
VHFAFAQAGSAFASAGQLVWQLPQCEGLLFASMQELPHWVSPAGHVDKQPPLAQTCPLLQVTEHDPQCATSDRSVSQPFAGLPSQSARPGAHVFAAQKPPWQVAVVAKGTEQGVHVVGAQP